MTDSLDAMVSPGEVIEYTVEILNAGTMDALGVNFVTTPDFNSTLIQSSLKVTPVANDDNHQAIVGIELSVPDGPGDLLDNDYLGRPAQATLTSFGSGVLGGAVTDFAPGSTANSASGALTVNADGSFSFVASAPGPFYYYYRISSPQGVSDGFVAISVQSQSAGTDRPGSITGELAHGAAPVVLCDEIGSPIEICIGMMSAGRIARVTFDVVVNCPFPQNVSNVAIQGVVLGDNFQDEFTTDPDQQLPSAPTVTQVDSAAPCIPTTVGPPDVMPPITLHKNAPNPFNPTTTIVYDLATAMGVDLRVYDSAGRWLTTLRDGEWQRAGSHSVIWNGRDSQNEKLSSGVYYYVLEAAGTRQVDKMTMIK